MALPVFEVPVLQGRWCYLRLRCSPVCCCGLWLCCAQGIGTEEAEAYQATMHATSEVWRAMNHSFQLVYWRGSSEARGRLVLSSGPWSDMWIDERKKFKKSCVRVS